MAIGRTSQPRTVASVGTTSSSAALTAPAGSFSTADVGRPISGTGIPDGATLSAVASSTAATLSANATASGTVTATIGGDAADSYGFSGWSPETEAEAGAYTGATAGENEPSRITDDTTAWGSKRRARTSS